jgi:CheY-like chemotaxis protein
VYGAVKQSEGFVSVESLPGRGANFRLYFPSVNVETPTADRFLSHPPQGTGTVLLVEDEPEVCRVTTALLTRLGYRVLTAATGEDALSVAREQGPGMDVLVTDVVMPGMSGVELAERLRASVPALPVVFLTGYADQEMPAGAIVLEKPYSPADLAKILARLRNSGSDTAVRRARQQPPVE